jgi:RNA polymerase sigma-70 factor, ECF subfamily
VGAIRVKIKNYSIELRFNSGMVHISPDIDDLLRSTEPDQEYLVETLVERYRTALYRLAISILRDPDEANDAVQETFIAVIVNLDKYQVGTNFKAWLYKLALNICRGYLRKRRARETMQRSLWIVQSNACSVEQTALQRESNSDLWSAVDGLKNRHRLAVLLRFRHHLSVKEIAQILEINEKTVYNRLYDAFRKLQVQLEMDGDEEQPGKRIKP